MLWFWVPPSDQPAKWYVTPPRDCGVGALMELLEPTITVRLKGVACVRPLMPTWSPPGLVAKLSATVLGWSVTLRVCVRPPESVAVRRSSRCDGYSWSGATKDPAET